MARFDELGDRIKAVEDVESSRTLMPFLPIVVRLDGIAFHTFTKGLEFPIDVRLRTAMTETTKKLVADFQASVGYVQSDEISLVFLPSDNPNDRLYRGRIQKLVSVFAAKASVIFNAQIAKYLPHKLKENPAFDARVFNAPSLQFAAETLLWRELDATRNSLSMAARAHYSQKEVHKKNTAQLHDMLMAKGVNWNDYPAFFKKGSYFKRITVESELDASTLSKIPEKHRKPGAVVVRTKLVELDIPPLAKISNMVEVLFYNEPPILRSVDV